MRACILTPCWFLSRFLLRFERSNQAVQHSPDFLGVSDQYVGLICWNDLTRAPSSSCVSSSAPEPCAVQRCWI